MPWRKKCQWLTCCLLDLVIPIELIQGTPGSRRQWVKKSLATSVLQECNNSISIVHLIFRAKTKDLHLPAYQTVVKISHTHNHMIDSADTLKHRDVSKETVEKFKDLFSRGHSPASALKTHKLDLQQQYDQYYVYEAADRAKCPDIYFCHRWEFHIIVLLALPPPPPKKKYIYNIYK